MIIKKKNFEKIYCMKSWTRTTNTMMNVKKPDSLMSLDGVKSQITSNGFAQNEGF